MPGSATLSVNLNTNNIEDASNFANGSFAVTNTGTSGIEYIELDVSDSLFPDSVFDPFGLAGDTLAKIFTPEASSATATGMVTPAGGFGPSAIGTTYIGPGGADGFSKIRVEFTDFNPGEVFLFGVDMDPKSVAGADKNRLEAASPVPNAGGDDEWHVGAISGAELIGSTFTAGFAGGSTASGQLMGQGNNFVSGSVALADTASPNATVDLQVNGLGAGAAGAYVDGGPTVAIQGRAGDTARIALAKGIQTPFTNPFTGAYGTQFQAQMDELAASDFPANNVVEMQYVDVLLDGTVQDVTSQFDFTGVTENFIFPFPENELPLAFSASAITPSTGLPTGPVTSPIHLIFDGTPAVGDVITAINAGGGAVTQNGIDYEADTLFIGGKTYTDGASGNDSTGNAAAFDATIYETERFAGGEAGTSFEYNIAVEDGFYDVELNFAEIFQDAAGERIFNVEVEGQQVLTDFDILAEAIGDTNATLSKVIKGVYSGLDGDATNLSIRFSSGSADRAKLSGLVVRRGEEAAPEVVRAINTGGGALEQDGIPFEADTESIGGKIYADGTAGYDRTGNQAALDGTVGETERFGSSFSYAIDVAEAGEYDVDLLFSEIYFVQPGARMFNVDIEGTRVLTNYDILTEGGGNVNTQLTEHFSGINSADFGSATAIEIDFNGVTQNAKVSGIVITQDSPLKAMTGASQIDPLADMVSDMLLAANSNLF